MMMVFVRVASGLGPSVAHAAGRAKGTAAGKERPGPGASFVAQLWRNFVIAGASLTRS